MARKKQDVLVLFPDIMAGTRKLTDAQFGALMRAVFAYRFQGSSYEGDDIFVDMAFGFVKNQLDRYQEVCEINRNNKTKKEIPDTCCNEMQRNATECNEMERNPTHNHSHIHNQIHNHTHNHIQTHSQTHSQSESAEAEKAEGLEKERETNDFVPPTLVEVSEYARKEKLLKANPISFYFHYHNLGWLDSEGKPIQDWKGLLHYWNKTEIKTFSSAP